MNLDEFVRSHDLLLASASERQEKYNKFSIEQTKQDVLFELMRNKQVFSSESDFSTAYEAVITKVIAAPTPNTRRKAAVLSTANAGKLTNDDWKLYQAQQKLVDDYLNGVIASPVIAAAATASPAKPAKPATATPTQSYGGAGDSSAHHNYLFAALAYVAAATLLPKYFNISPMGVVAIVIALLALCAGILFQVGEVAQDESYHVASRPFFSGLAQSVGYIAVGIIRNNAKDIARTWPYTQKEKKK